MHLNQFRTVMISVFIIFSCQDDQRAFHFESYVADTHNDVLGRGLNGVDILIRSKTGHTDFPCQREGGIVIEVF